MAAKFEIKGFFFIITDVDTDDQILRIPKDKVRHSRDRDDVFWFSNNIAVVNSFGASNLNILGSEDLEIALPGVTKSLNQTTFPFLEIIDNRTGLAFTSADALDLFLSNRLGVGIIPKENKSVYKMLAQAQPAAANTTQLLYSPNANEEVHIETISVVNVNNQDVDMIFYLDDVGTTWDDSTTIANPSIPKDGFAPSIWQRAKIFMNNENGSIAFEAGDTDVTVTVWGVIYDLS